MKLFSSDRYTKPGKGVEKNEKQKPAFIRFFIVFWNKFWSIVGMDFIYVVFNILIIGLTYLIFQLGIYFVSSFNGGVEFINKALAGDELSNEWLTKAYVFFIMFFTCVPVYAFGPFKAGHTYLFKSFYKGEPVFLWHDFITKTRSNMSLGIKVSLFNFVVGIVVFFSTMAAFVISDPSVGLPWAFCFVEWILVIFFALLLSMMTLYQYPMMVTFNVTFRQLMKNSFILCIVKWFRNICVLLLDALIIAVPLLLLPSTDYLVFVINIILYMTLTPGIIQLVNIFAIYPVLKKYLIDNPNADKSDKQEDEKEEEVIPETKSTGRFENGMWIND